MKKCTTIAFTVLFLICSIGVKAQNTQSGLDQVKLIKPLIGSFKCDLAKDTVATWKVKSFAKGYELNYKFLAKGKPYIEIRDLWGFDSKSDKWVCFSLQTHKKDYALFYAKFVTSNEFIWDQFFITDTEAVSEKYCIEIVSSDKFILYTMINGTKTNGQTFNRTKE
jgi:hypothetical protein